MTTWLAAFLCQKLGHRPSLANPWICERCGQRRRTLEENFR